LTFARWLCVLLDSTSSSKSLQKCLNSAERLKSRLLDAESQRRVYEKKLARLTRRINGLDQRLNGVQPAPTLVPEEPLEEQETESTSVSESKFRADCFLRHNSC